MRLKRYQFFVYHNSKSVKFADFRTLFFLSNIQHLLFLTWHSVSHSFAFAGKAGTLMEYVCGSDFLEFNLETVRYSCGAWQKGLITHSKRFSRKWSALILSNLLLKDINIIEIDYSRILVAENKLWFDRRVLYYNSFLWNFGCNWCFYMEPIMVLLKGTYIG